MQKDINNIAPTKMTTVKVLLLILPIICTSILCILRYYSFSIVKLLPPCAFYQKTSLLCPGCGMTRSVLALFHGDILTCLKSNVSIILIFVFCFLEYLELLAISFNKKLLLLPRSPSFYWTGLTLLVFYWIIRNLSLFPLLKP